MLKYGEQIERSDDITLVIFKYKNKHNNMRKTIYKALASQDKYKDFYRWLHKICDQWQINDELKNKLDMCGEEIHANIAFYAYPQTEGDIRVAVLKDETQITLKFADDGIPLPPEQRLLGGLGIFMVKEMADNI